MPARLITVFAMLIVALVPLSSLGASQPDTTSPCGVWQTDPPPAVAPAPIDADRKVNDGEVNVRQVGDILPGRPTAIAISPGGDIYVAVTYNTTYPLSFSSAVYGSIFLVNDDGSHLLIDGLHFPNGLAFIGDNLYVSQLGNVSRITDVDGTRCNAIEVVVDNLPFDDVHQTNGLATHDGRLYVSQGYVYKPLESSRTELRGTIFSVDPDGGDIRVEATGFRNAYGIAFDDQGRLWASDNGPNVDYDPDVETEDDVTPDELNLVEPGGDYGFHPPVRHQDGAATPIASPVACAPSCDTPPAATFDKHVAPAGVVWDGANQQVLTALSSWGQVVAYSPETDTVDSVLWNLAIPTGLANDGDGTLYICEWMSQRVIEVAGP